MTTATQATQHVDLIEKSEGKILEINLSGTLNREDYQSFVPQIEDSIRRYGKIRLLVVMHDFHGWTAGAMWEDLKFDLKHFTHIERLALVGEKRWEAGMAVFCRPFTTANIRYFDSGEMGQARLWIEEP